LPRGTGWCYSKLKRKTGDFASAAAAVLLRMQGGSVADAQIALTNLGATPLRANAAEAFLRGKPLSDAAFAEAARLAMSICSPGRRSARQCGIQNSDGRRDDPTALRTRKRRAK